jgi:HEAT repeat protein/CRP-like cAMP-binding protein
MLNRLFRKSFKRVTAKDRLLILFLLIAASMMALNGLAFTVGSSLFLTHGGPDNLPFSYILMGLLSVPIYGWFSQVVDRFNRAKLFQYMLVATVVFSVLLRVFIPVAGLPLYYAMFIGFYFQWEMHTDILFPSLVSDYFSSLDYKRYASFLAMAMAAGGLVGGGLTSILANYFTTEDILLTVPLVCAVTIAQLAYLQCSFQQLGGNKHEETASGFLNDLKTFPNLVKRYPIIIYLATSAFLVIILATIGEFQFFSIYSLKFPEEQKLTAFMGQMRIINNVVQFVVLYFFTQPLVQRLGVGPMNLAYPITTLVSFFGLGINFELPAAIAAHVNKEPLEFSINKPVNTLDYNAVPYRYVGRVRALNEGLFSGIGLSFAGGLLWICQSMLTPAQITGPAIILSLVFVAFRYQLGKSYLQSLLTLLRSESIRLDDVGEGLIQLPVKYLSQVRQLLSSPHYDQRVLGLELAARLDNPSQVLELVDDLVNSVDATVRRAIIKFLSIRHPDISRYLGSLLTCDSFPLQLIALEALIASQQFLTNSEIRRILRSTPVRTIAAIGEASHQSQGVSQIRQVMREKSQIQALVCLAAMNAGNQNPEIQAVCERLWVSKLDSLTQMTVIRAIRSTNNRALIPLLLQILNDTTDAVKRDGLEVLASLARPEDTHLAELAVEQLSNRNSLVQAAAFNLLGVIRSPKVLERVVAGLKHRNLAVRLQAAEALGKYGEISLPFSEELLRSPRQEVVEAAISAIAKVGTAQAEDILYQYLKSDYRLIDRTVQWQEFLGNQDSLDQPLAIVIKDYHQRLRHRVLYVLSCLDHSGTFSYVRQILHTRDLRARAAAVEALSSGRHRRFVLPIIPLLEKPDLEPSNSGRSLEITDRTLWEEALESGDRWIMIGVLLTAHREFLVENFADLNPQEPLADLLVQDVADYLIAPLEQREAWSHFFINRVLFLKTVALLKRLFLDELLLINRALTYEEFPAGGKICIAGQILNQMYIVYQGTIVLTQPDPPMAPPLKNGGVRGINVLLDRDESQPPREIRPGDYFGEMALLDDSPFDLTAIAQTDTVTLTLDRYHFEQLIEICPRLLTCLSGTPE